MSDENINRKELREQEQSSETLLVVDKKKKKVQVVKGVDKEGNLETVDTTEKNQNQFIRVNPGGDFLSNFFSNFVSQLKNPTNFSFFNAPINFVVEIAEELQRLTDNPTQKSEEFLKKNELKAKLQQEQKQENKNNMEKTATTKENRYQPEQIDWKAMSDIGLSKEKLEKMKILEPLLKGYKTNLVSLSFNTGQTTVRTDARLSLRQNAEGKVGVEIHGIRKEPQLNFPFFGHEFTQEDKENLLKTGNMGRVVDLTNIKTGDVIPSVISVDRLTNELVALRSDWIKIPDEIKGVVLNDEQKQTLQEGKPLYIEGMISKKGTPFSAEVQFNADKRYVEFLFDNAPKMKQTQTETDDMKKSSKSGQKASETKKQQEQQEKPKAPAKAKGRKM